jgi:hypothetical protein
MNSLTYLLHGRFSHITVWVEVQRGWLQFCLYAPDISFHPLKSVIVLCDFWKRKYDVKRTLYIGITLAPIVVGCFRMQWVITRPHTCEFDMRWVEVGQKLVVSAFLERESVSYTKWTIVLHLGLTSPCLLWNITMCVTYCSEFYC